MNYEFGTVAVLVPGFSNHFTMHHYADLRKALKPIFDGKLHYFCEDIDKPDEARDNFELYQQKSECGTVIVLAPCSAIGDLISPEADELYGDNVRVLFATDEFTIEHAQQQFGEQLCVFPWSLYANKYFELERQVFDFFIAHKDQFAMFWRKDA